MSYEDESIWDHPVWVVLNRIAWPLVCFLSLVVWDHQTDLAIIDNQYVSKEEVQIIKSRLIDRFSDDIESDLSELKSKLFRLEERLQRLEVKVGSK